ncbi:MAG: hypothetical protein KF764_25470 [Labilithrix sp.]|nr:hypothetical protein [Labilithrix sp.]
MAGPPENIDPSALWLQLSEMPRPRRVVDYPRTDPVTGKPIGRVVLQPLSGMEAKSAAIEAGRRTTQAMKTPRKEDAAYDYDTVYSNESTYQILFRAVTREEAPGVGFFPSPDHIAAMPQEEIGALLRMYLTVKRELGPDVQTMTADEMDAWLEVLARGGSAYPLARLDLEAIQDLVTHSARRLFPSLTVTTSSGSPPESSTPTG